MALPEEDVCGVVGCGQPAARSLATEKVKAALPDVNLMKEPRRTHLCRTHYKAFRKKTKQERELDRLGW